MNTPIIYPTGHRTTRLTAKDAELLAYIADYQQTHDGQSPALRDMMHALAYSSTSVVNYRVNQLVKLGHLRKGRGARALILTHPPQPGITVQEVATPRGTLVIADKRLDPGKRYEVTIREVSEE